VLAIGIWSMHFVGMFAMEMEGMDVTYGLSLVICSFAIAAINSVLSLYLFTRPSWTRHALIWGAAVMAIAIAGMHYVAMYSMRMAATIRWRPSLLVASVLVALIVSFGALSLAHATNRNYAEWLESPSSSFDDRWPVIRGSILLGLAIAGMHYTGMMAAIFVPSPVFHARGAGVLSTTSLATLVATLSVMTLVLSIASGQVERTLARSAVRLRKERELRSHFVSAIVHDLRNPLSAARLSVQLLSRAKDPDALRATSKTALENLTRMDQLIQSLLDAQRISTGQPLPIQVERLELCSLLRTTLESLSGIYGNRFQLECDHAVEGDWDPSFLRRAVENLCTNAVKYGARDAPIKVSVTSAGPGMERVSLQVQNQGEPLSCEEGRSLFELFRRGPKAEQSGERGWGLGLTIVKGVAEAHGGEVRVESDHERGTVFTLELPVHPQSVH
jgi:signal transduction histidine kinase